MISDIAMKNRHLHVFLIGLLVAMLGGPVYAQKNNTPSKLLNFNRSTPARDGSGYLVAGDFWSTVHPVNAEIPNLLRSQFAGIGLNYVMMLGSTGNWQEPIGSWPSGYPYTNTFRNSPLFFFSVFDADGWAGYAPGNRLRDLDQTTDARGAGGTSRFMFPAYGPDVVGAGDPARDYRRPARFTDESRTHMIYEAGWPTTAGIDFKIRAHQYSSNEQNLNDFVAIEVTLTNTGVVDSNADGTPEATDNVVDGIASTVTGDVAPSIQISTAGDRGCNCIAAGRTFGYVGAPDETGAPYDMFVWYANVAPTTTTNRATPPAGQRSFGIDNTNQRLGYSDIWNTWVFMGVRQGSLEDGLTANSPDKPTVFGTHSVGEGSRRGWYNSVHWQLGLANRNASDISFRNATATWYQDYGKLSNGGDVLPSLAPNPALFSGGTPDDISTFVVGNPNARPNGDFKYAHTDIGVGPAIEQPIWEPAWNPGAASGDFYGGGMGFSKEYTFGQAPQHSTGPFSLAVGESMTMVFVHGAGFRLEGAADAVEAARWAWERGWDISADMPTPAAPEMVPLSTDQGSALIRWTDVSGITPVDGYKIWRASQYQRTNYLDAGLRLMDNYHHLHEPGGDPFAAAFLDPVNPNFDVGDPDVYFQGDIQGSYQPAEWGTYELIARIPVSEVSQYQDATGGYDFAFEDTQVITGFTYWYYVSAYREGSFTGPEGPVTVNHIESANLNRNGRNSPDAASGEIGMESQWAGTYPYAFRNADYPTPGTQQMKNIGAPFTVTPPVAPVDQVADLVTVTPNPYKITGLNDIRNDASSHNIDFLNLPADYTLTILDVSGQIIFQTNVQGAVDGKYTWDLFSKDGVEVASGLYIYHVEFAGGTAEGHFAILR